MKLVFVYNANSGLWDKIMDGAHKIMSPKTYDCNLCAITFGAFSEDELWKAFRENAGHEMEFYHRDEFNEKFELPETAELEFPVIYRQEGSGLQPLIPASTINKFSTSEALIEEINRLAAH